MRMAPAAPASEASAAESTASPPASPPAKRTAARTVARDSATRHRPIEDLQGLQAGTLLVSLGLALYRDGGFVTGGTAGLALLAHHLTQLPFGLLFTLINLPFYVLAWRRMGARFALKTGAAVALLNLLVATLPALLHWELRVPWFAALAGGVLMGTGMLILFRHGATLGGFNTLVLWLQERRGWSAGQVQLGIDALVLLLSLPWLSGATALGSLAGTAVLNAVLALNHKPGRYTGW